MNMDETGVTEITSIESVKNPDQNSTLMESKNSMCPKTPHFTKENEKFRLKFNYDDEASTPIEDVFDPYKLMLDPSRMNHPGSSAARKLDFISDECVPEITVENGSLMETVYESVLEAIICKQAEDILAEILAPDSNHDGLRTPPSVARVIGLDETCPGAPLKPKQVRKLKDVNMSLCRKLDFDSHV